MVRIYLTMYVHGDNYWHFWPLSIIDTQLLFEAVGGGTLTKTNSLAIFFYFMVHNSSLDHNNFVHVPLLSTCLHAGGNTVPDYL